MFKCLRHNLVCYASFCHKWHLSGCKLHNVFQWQEIQKSQIHNNNNSRPQLQIKTSVIKGLESNQPVVALESTLITHGMPYPQNLQ